MEAMAQGKQKHFQNNKRDAHKQKDLSRGANKQHKWQKDHKKDPNSNRDANKKALKFVDLGKLQSYAQAAKLMSQAFDEYKDSPPGSLQFNLVSFI